MRERGAARGAARPRAARGGTARPGAARGAARLRAGGPCEGCRQRVLPDGAVWKRGAARGATRRAAAHAAAVERPQRTRAAQQRLEALQALLLDVDQPSEEVVQCACSPRDNVRRSPQQGIPRLPLPLERLSHQPLGVGVERCRRLGRLAIPAHPRGHWPRLGRLRLLQGL